MTGKGKGKAYLINKPKFITRTSDDSTKDSSCKWEDLPMPPQGNLPNLDIEGIRNPPLKGPYLPPQGMSTPISMETRVTKLLMNSHT
jgi:hypothetical protein